MLIGVHGRRHETDAFVVSDPELHPVLAGFLQAMRRTTLGVAGPNELQDAVDDLFDEQDAPPPKQESDGHDFEIDVVVLRGHRVFVLSCMAGDDEDKVRWKSREIARRAVQIGGELAHCAFVLDAGFRWDGAPSGGARGGGGRRPAGRRLG